MGLEQQIETLEAKVKELEFKLFMKDNCQKIVDMIGNLPQDCPHGRHLSKFCSICDNREKMAILEVENKLLVAVVEAERMLRVNPHVGLQDVQSAHADLQEHYENWGRSEYRD